MLYLAFADMRFEAQAREEVEASFHEAKIRMYQGEQGVLMLLIESGGKLDPAHFSFVDSVVKVEMVIDRVKDDFEKITGGAASVLAMHSGTTFRIEARKVDASMEGRARDIEVKVGSALEKRGFVVDLKSPGMSLYLVFRGERLYVGSSEDNDVLDHFRHEGRAPQETVNRSEFKLREAVEFFHIDLSKIESCLDVGAAPGGWSHYLAGEGVKVVALDGAQMDYHKFEGKRLVVVEDVGTFDASASYNILHIRMHLNEDSMRLIERLGRFGMLAIDVNLSPAESAGIANLLAGRLETGAPLVMTLKMVDNGFRKNIDSATRALSDSYDVVGVKKLPHNRRELTLFAKRK